MSRLNELGERMAEAVIEVDKAENPGEYAIVIDEPYDAVLLRDLLQKAAQEHHTKASKATQRKALNDNTHKHEVFAKYADRCEYIRKSVADRISRSLGVEPRG